MITQTLKLKYEASAPRILKLWKEANEKNLTDSSINGISLTKFVKHLEDKLAPSSARQYAAQLKAVLNVVRDDVKLPTNFAKILSLKAAENISTYLTTEEISKFASYTPKSDKETSVWALFLLECYTGARTSDCERFGVGNIVDGNIDYVSQKTHKHAVIPCKPIVEEIISKGLHKKAKVATSTQEATIARICKAVGIDSTTKVFESGKEQVGSKYEFITSHSGRRSFATNLYLLDRDLFAISKMMGHTTIEMTLRYICVDMVQLSASAMTYFK